MTGSGSPLLRAFVAVAFRPRHYVGLLTEHGVAQRDGSTACPACSTVGFEPLGFGKLIGCVGCDAAYSIRRSATLGDVFGDMFRGLIDRVRTAPSPWSASPPSDGPAESPADRT